MEAVTTRVQLIEHDDGSFAVETTVGDVTVVQEFGAEEREHAELIYRLTVEELPKVLPLYGYEYVGHIEADGPSTPGFGVMHDI